MSFIGNKIGPKNRDAALHPAAHIIDDTDDG